MAGSPTELASLLLLADGRLPTGGHANGVGVEWAARHDDLADPETLAAWIEARLDTVGRVEAAFAVAAATTRGSLSELDTELDARLVGPRAREVSRQMGRQLLRFSRRVWKDTSFDRLDHPEGPHHSIVFGVTAAAVGAGPVPTATLLLHHHVASAISATVRLLACDPIELAALQARCSRRVADIAADARRWSNCPPARLPARSMPLAEVLAEDHGTWTSRLFLA